MLWVLNLVFSLAACVGVDGKFYKINLTDFSKCQVHYSKNGDLYRDFYEISDFAAGGKDLMLDFHFSVLAPSDAHLLLSPSSNLTRGDPVYEIVIGAGGNTFSDIRRQQKSAVRATSRKKGLLSDRNIRSFWLHISKDGLIEIGRQGDELAFLFWQDPDPLPVKVFSFSTWFGVEVKWFFDCPWGVNETAHSKKIERKLTDLERLRKDLLSGYDPYVQPVFNSSQLTDVSITLAIFYLSLDERRSIAEVKGSTKMTWRDEKLKWNASEYGNVASLHIYRREAWRPDLILFNSVDSGRDIFSDSMMVIGNKGVVEWNPKIEMAFWCNASDFGHWPSDVHKLKLMLGLGRDRFTMNLQLANSSFVLEKQPSWDITEVEVVSNFASANDNSQLIYSSKPNVELWLKVKRRSDMYTVAFFTPFLFIALIIMSTFWVSPFGHLKITLGCISLLLSSVMIIGLAFVVPAHPEKVPFLVILHSYALVASLISVIISVVVINLSRTSHHYSIPRALEVVLTSCIAKFVLSLPDHKASKEYGNLNETRHVQGLWILLGVAIDRIAFQVCLILSAVAIFMKY